MIFFDVDETLFDFKRAELLAVQYLYHRFPDKFNLNFSDFYDSWCTIGYKHFNRFLCKELTFQQQKIERIKDLFYQAGTRVSDDEAIEHFTFYSHKFEENWMAFDDVIPCLEALKGYELGIITNGDTEQQRMKLKRIGILHYFSVIVTAGEIGIAKPDRGIFEYACQTAGKQPRECYYVGDDFATDILACEKVNMKGIWINRRNEIQESTCRRIIRNLEQLREQF